MIVEIIEKVLLKNIPSASGIEIIEDIIYIIGDDSHYLYCLDLSLNLINRIELFKSNDFTTGRIPKAIKPDFECMTQLVIENDVLLGKKYLLIIGSGSKSTRDKAFLIDISNNNIKEISLTPIYDKLRDNKNFTSGLNLNIEGLASDNDYLYLLNRTNNHLFIYNINEFIQFIFYNSKIVPEPLSYKYELKGLNNIRAGFSGATIYDEKLFFTTSVENTLDPIFDGEVYGSFTGYMNINKNVAPELKDYLQVNESSEHFTKKVESISIYKKINQSSYLAFAVTDDDLGSSELLKLKIDI